MSLTEKPSQGSGMDHATVAISDFQISVGQRFFHVIRKTRLLLRQDHVAADNQILLLTILKTLARKQSVH